MTEDLLDEDVQIITLQDDEGKEIDFILIADIEYNDKEYYFLQPADANEDEEEVEVILFELEFTEEDEMIFKPVNDEDTIDALYEEFLKLRKECGCEDGECDCDDCHHDHD